MTEQVTEQALVKSDDNSNLERAKKDTGNLTMAFRRLAESIAEARFVVPPTLLGPTERRQHVRRTLREDHQYRLHHRPAGALKKFDKLTVSPFTFFRGTALLFYRDLAGWDADRPVAFLIGDVHPENFGVMPSSDGTPFFGPNDFDEAYHGPFSWDLRRGGVGFNLAARERGLKKKKRAAIVDALVKGYFDQMHAIERDPRHRDHQFRIDNSPPLIKDLLLAARRDRARWLERLVDLDQERFRPSDDIVPLTSQIPKFQRLVSGLAPDGVSEAHFEVKDVALRKGGGTASLGLDKYYVLIDGPSRGEHDDVILEMKHTRASALRDLVPHVSSNLEDGADRVVLAQRTHLAGGDPYYGHTTIDGESFLVRERSPYKKSIKVERLEFKDFKKYARICGEAVALVHARSDEAAGANGHSKPIESRVLHSVSTHVFRNDMVHFAEDGARRVRQDYKTFCEDHALGAFKPGRFNV